LQRTKKLALTAVGGTDFSYNAGFYTLSPGNTNTTYLRATDFNQSDLQYGFTIHAKFSVDSDASRNVHLLSLRSPSILQNSIFTQPAVTSGTTTQYNTSTIIPNWFFSIGTNGRVSVINNTNTIGTSYGSASTPILPLGYSVSIQSSFINQTFIRQSFNCFPGSYVLYFYASGANNAGSIYTGGLDVKIDGTTVLTIATSRLSIDFMNILMFI
jgi:hypothetical protein